MGPEDDIEDYKERLKKELKRQLLEEIYEEISTGKDGGTKPRGEEIDKMMVESKVEASMRSGASSSTGSRQSGKGAKVVLSTRVVLKFITHALKYANKDIPRSDWVEVIGLLAGTHDPATDILNVEDAYPMGHGSAVYAEIKDYKNFVRAFNDLKKQGYFVCGWYHSHPTYGCFLSDEDMGTQARYQRLWDESIALVVDPYLVDGTDYGFKIFRANLDTGNYYPVDFRLREPLDPSVLPELVNFIRPIVGGKALYLEYDEPSND